MNPPFAYSFLVPIDFTDKTLHALEYAAAIVRKYDGMIHLLHIVDERNDPGEDAVNQIREKTIQFARDQHEKLGVNIVPNVVTGNIFVSIGDTARKLGVQLIVMGIHGMHGIQFIIGSFAARVILGSPVPVILTKGKKPFSGFGKIILPADNRMEMGELLKKTIELGKLFSSTIHLYSKNEELPLLKRIISTDVSRKILRQIRKSGLSCQNISIDASYEDFTESLLKYSENIDADMIMVTASNQQYSKEYIIVETGIRLMERSNTPLYFLNWNGVS